MPRPRRRNFNDPDHAHALTFSCYHGYKFMRSERCCQWFADSIRRAGAMLRFDLWAYVFMPEHVHLLIHPREPVYDIAAIRRAIKSPVARKAIRYIRANRPQWLPRLTRTRGGRTEYLFWQSGGGYDRNIDRPKTLWSVIEYFHLNPVRRGLVSDPCQYQWSSAAFYHGVGQSPVPLDPIPVQWRF